MDYYILYIISPVGRFAQSHFLFAQRYDCILRGGFVKMGIKKKNRKKLKKGVDKWGMGWYSNQAVRCEPVGRVKIKKFFEKLEKSS